jgi:hypothetical protein
VTSILVVAFRIKPVRYLTPREDTSTSTSELAPRDGLTPSRVTALSFGDEQARVEWPRKRTPQSREARIPI